MTKVLWRKFRTFSGPLIRGKRKFELAKPNNHWDRVAWLTANVESGGKFGAVIGYDGTGMTAGITQAIAVYPRAPQGQDLSQGPLWTLIERIRKDEPKVVADFDKKIRRKGWFTGSRGEVRSYKTKEVVSGQLIREEFTPHAGKTPPSGPEWDRSKDWALLLHQMFSDPRTFDIQVEYSIDHFLNNSTKEHRFIIDAKRRIDKKLNDNLSPNSCSLRALVYDSTSGTSLLSSSSYLDLALAVFHSHSVNAPGIAFRKLAQAIEIFTNKYRRWPNLDDEDDRFSFSKLLITVLANTTFGRWNYTDAEGRYHRTRRTAMKVWHKSFFKGERAIMPRRL